MGCAIWGSTGVQYCTSWGSLGVPSEGPWGSWVAHFEGPGFCVCPLIVMSFIMSLYCHVLGSQGCPFSCTSLQVQSSGLTAYMRWGRVWADRTSLQSSEPWAWAEGRFECQAQLDEGLHSNGKGNVAILKVFDLSGTYFGSTIMQECKANRVRNWLRQWRCSWGLFRDWIHQVLHWIDL